MGEKADWEGKGYSFVQNLKCEYFPCHVGVAEADFNCLFCYCPLYALGEGCGGAFLYTDKGIKSCERCAFPHQRENYEALLAQAKKELYDKLHPELIEKLLADMKEELREEMRQQTEQLTTYINETLKNAILEQLTTEINDRQTKLSDMLTEKFDVLGKQLNESLYEKLYFDLFENLFKALYVPEPEEEKFVPLI